MARNKFIQGAQLHLHLLSCCHQKRLDLWQTNNMTQCTFKNPARVSLLLGDQCESGFCEPEFEEGSRLQNPGQQTKQWERAEAGSRVRIGKVNRTSESYGTKHRDSRWIVAGLMKQESGSWSTAANRLNDWINQSGKFVFWRISPPQNQCSENLVTFAGLKRVCKVFAIVFMLVHQDCGPYETF